MYKIIDTKSSGKTGRLMLLVKENGGVLACSNPKAMEEKARGYGITGIEFISYYDLLFGGIKYDNIYIDDLEFFSQYALMRIGTVKGFTISLED